MLRNIHQTLVQDANQINMLQENSLQERIREFIKSDQSCIKEDQFKRIQAKGRSTHIFQQKPNLIASPDGISVDNKILDEYNEQKHRDWFGSSLGKGQDYQIDTSTFVYRQETLAHSFCGLPIECITITAHYSRTCPLSKRKVVFISARVHAAEVPGSFKIEGILKFLISSNPFAGKLRELYIFKIIPMLNPEGVVCGNFRCSLTGTDLNRCWANPNEVLHPQIYYLKYLLKKLVSEKREIGVFCDFHGHSRKLNSFIFGCNRAAKGSFCSWTKVRLLPRILATKTPLFNFRDCRFRVETDKQSTARVVLWREFSVTNSFTFESSFYGYAIGDKIEQFTNSDYMNLGKTLALTLLDYYYVLKGLEKELLQNSHSQLPVTFFYFSSRGFDLGFVWCFL